MTWRVISGEGEEENGGKGTGNKKHKWKVQNKTGREGGKVHGIRSINGR